MLGIYKRFDELLGEVQSINASGFYAMNTKKFVTAINTYFSK